MPFSSGPVRRTQGPSASGVPAARPGKRPTRWPCWPRRRSPRRGRTVDVLGTDVSHAALAGAADGRYRERAVRALEPDLRSRYFHRAADGSYVVGDLLRSLVRFRPHNLARDPGPPPGEACFDLITCRNVLIYFSPPLVSTVIDSLDASLRPGGALMLGAADALHRLDHGRPRPVTPGRTGGRDHPGPGCAARSAGSPRCRVSSGWPPRWTRRTLVTATAPWPA